MSRPLREPSYFVLAALIDGPLHGYAILKQVLELSDGRVRLSTGTLYGALERLTADGLLLPGAEEVVEGRPRRAYSLTPTGLTAVTAEAERLEAAARVVMARTSIVRVSPA
ncbi:helix-turn-helix transcriptional regulator [Kineosporia mesophila]|uniref:Helix-turn-helix transcriptional regulator n=1 Tax=Kineosporia mesophila TaxID=566012 RepID=A0ABP6ZNB5_9ACTN|nr:PadR family transcriptional regulator [Kineosporia mesophila]MCD5354754.1 PadR family transcriptional regulator [Kineosporia mesophila]